MVDEGKVPVESMFGGEIAAEDSVLAGMSTVEENPQRPVLLIVGAAGRNCRR
jgi:hypothetical protein